MNGIEYVCPEACGRDFFPTFARKSETVPGPCATKHCESRNEEYPRRVLFSGSKEVAGLRGVEPPTTWFVARCSIQLSYRPAETTRAFPLDYDTLPATSTASRTFGAGFLSRRIHLRSSALICGAFELARPAVSSLTLAATPRKSMAHSVWNCSPRRHAPVTISRYFRHLILPNTPR